MRILAEFLAMNVHGITHIQEYHVRAGRQDGSNVAFIEIQHVRDHLVFGQRMMRIYAQGNVRLHDLVTARLPITAWSAAFDLSRDRKALKVVLHP